MTQTVHYALTWISAPRPPVHPETMTGRQCFESVEKAYLFWLNLPMDAEFTSLEEICTTYTDFSRIFKNIIEEEK